MRIALVTGTFLPNVGGLEWKVHFLATEYCRQGHEATVYHVKLPRYKDGPLPVKPAYQVVGIGPRPFPGYGRLGIAEFWFSRRLRANWRRSPFDVLHCHGIDLPTRFGVRVKQWRRIPVVATTSGHDIVPMPEIGWGLRSRPYYERMIRENMRQVDAVGAISHRARQELEAMGTTARILDIPNGVDWETFQRPGNDWLRQRLGLPASALLVVSLGRLHAIKGYEVGIEAFGLLAAKVPEVHYVIVGRGVPGLQPVAARSPYAGRIHLVDGVSMSEVPSVLWSADVFFSPSLAEGFAQVAVQAMACARPCVLSDCPGNEDFRGQPYVSQGRSGDAASLARALEEVVRNESRRREMSLAAHQVSRRYAWSAIAREYLEVFGGLVGKFPQAPA